MSYIEKHLLRNENVVLKAHRSAWFLVAAWIKGILFFWMLLIPTFKAIKRTFSFFSINLAVTDKRIVGRFGNTSTKTLDAPLNKIQNVSVKQTFFGKIFNYGNMNISTAAGTYYFNAIKAPERVKLTIMEAIDEHEKNLVMEQAKMMATAMNANRQ